MTAPRQVLEGTTYLVTRRCSERRFFLRPSKKTDAIFRYLLAYAAGQCDIRVHAFCVLSNHFHLVVTDPHARLPEFNRILNGLVARATNCHLGRWESFWDPDSYSAVRLETPDAVLEKMVYVLANAVAAGLVRRGSEWPGLWSDPRLIDGEAIEAARPEGFFRKLGRMPAITRLQLTRPPGFDGDDAFLVLVECLRLAGTIRTPRSGRSGGRACRAASRKTRSRPPSRESLRPEPVVTGRPRDLP